MENQKIIYPELSYKIVGCLFDVYKKLGNNRKENIYQNALKQEFLKRNINFKDQYYIQVNYNGVNIGRSYVDFLIENKIILELKIGNFYHKQNLDQILDYLKSTSLKLGIIANFTRDGVKFYRVLNIK